MSTGLIVVAALVVLIVVLAVLAFRPGGGMHINEGTANVLRQAHEDAKRRPAGGVGMMMFDAPDDRERRRE